MSRDRRIFLLWRVKARAGSDAQKSATAFFSLPCRARRVASRFCAARVSLPRIFSVSSVPHTHTIVFMRPRLLAPSPALRRARSVYAGCIRVGEVSDPRVIAGLLSCGTYINPSSPFTYISLSGAGQELVEFYTRDNVRDSKKSLSSSFSFSFILFT